MKSALDSIPGVGPKRRRTLIKEFGSVRAIRQASAEELAFAEREEEYHTEKKRWLG